MAKRVLLMYISEISGHHSASLAVESAIKTLKPGVDTLNINCFNYTTPIWERIVNKTYMGVVHTKPEIWDYLYDNPRILKRSKRIREFIHRANVKKLKVLFDDFRPDAAVCTQAYPCGMVADYKKLFKVKLPLAGVLTDYSPHAYWIYDNVDAYIVPSEEIGRGIARNGIKEDRIKAFGIPIDPKFSRQHDRALLMKELGLDPSMPVVLIMGGGQGLGPIKRILPEFDAIKKDLQLLVVTGINKKLYSWIQEKKRAFRKKVLVFDHIDYIDRLMEVSSLVVTKPGGVTTAEALVKGLPIMIINPLPGQEFRNTNFLLKEGVAVKIKSEREAAGKLEELLADPGALEGMRKAAGIHARPDAALKTAEYILGL
ncbi:MAG: glycosyltransferase [Candidatus Omnitrophota bacterium]